MTPEILQQVRGQLVALSDENSKLAAQKFFKEQITAYGVKNPQVNSIANKYRPEIRKMSKSEVFDLCEQLWASGMHEESLVACIWSETVHKKYEPDDISVFERWVSNYVTNWATCDTLCNHTVGDLIMMYPEHLARLKQWARSDNRWMRRAAAVSLIVPAKKGLFLPDVLEIAEIMLTDPDDMVQKGYGWMLKSAAEYHQKEVFEFVVKNKSVMPRTALRYAIEKMSAHLKAEAMKKD